MTGRWSSAAGMRAEGAPAGGLCVVWVAGAARGYGLAAPSSVRDELELGEGCPVMELVLIVIYMVAPAAAITYGAFASGCARGDHRDEQSGVDAVNERGESPGRIGI